MDPRDDTHERPSQAADASLMQIGDVAERTGLSLRTIRYYEETGLIAPSSRTLGGFRLYAEADRERLESIKQMKPLGLTLEEMRTLLDLLDVAVAAPDDPSIGAAREEIARFAELCEGRCERLRAQYEAATRFTEMLRSESRPRRSPREGR
jgi:DNA-binding transcriptional MerR regulator